MQNNKPNKNKGAEMRLGFLQVTFVWPVDLNNEDMKEKAKENLLEEIVNCGTKAELDDIFFEEEESIELAKKDISWYNDYEI